MSMNGQTPKASGKFKMKLGSKEKDSMSNFKNVEDVAKAGGSPLKAERVYGGTGNPGVKHMSRSEAFNYGRVANDKDAIGRALRQSLPKAGKKVGDALDKVELKKPEKKASKIKKRSYTQKGKETEGLRGRAKRDAKRAGRKAGRKATGSKELAKTTATKGRADLHRSAQKASNELRKRYTGTKDLSKMRKTRAGRTIKKAGDTARKVGSKIKGLVRGRKR